MRELPYRYELDQFAHLVPDDLAEEYALKLERDGHITPDQVEDVKRGLIRAALYFHFGRYLEQTIPQQKNEPPDIRDLLKLPGRGNQKRYRFHGLIHVMAIVAEQCGIHPGTAHDWRYGCDTASRFQRFVEGWLSLIAPDMDASEFPRRRVYRTVLANL